MISRRRFLFTGLSVLALACRGDKPSEIDKPSPVPASGEKSASKTAEPITAGKAPPEAVDTSPVPVKAEIPARLLFPSRKPRRGSPFARVTSLRLQRPSELVISFAGGSELRLNPAASFNSLRGRKKVARNAVAVKSIVSWTLEGLDRSTRGIRDVDTYTRLRKQFRGLQEQRVLEAASLGAVFELVKEIQARGGIKSVQFAKGRFIVK